MLSMLFKTKLYTFTALQLLCIHYSNCMLFLFSFQQSSCVYNEDYTGAKMSGIVTINQGSESDLLGAVANVGPVAVAVDGSSNAFRVSVCILTVHCLVVHACVDYNLHV